MAASTLDIYCKGFSNMELASTSNFLATYDTALELINAREQNCFMQAPTEEVLYENHRRFIFGGHRKNSKKVESEEYDSFRRRLSNFACLVKDPHAFMLFFGPLRVSNPPSF